MFLLWALVVSIHNFTARCGNHNSTQSTVFIIIFIIIL